MKIILDGLHWQFGAHQQRPLRQASSQAEQFHSKEIN